MAMTSEERSEYPLCGAKKKNGELCRAFAGQGTDHHGVGACKYHGGATPSHKTHAAKVEAERRMVTMGAPVAGITPAKALKGLLQATTGHVAWLSEEVANLGSLEGPEAVMLTKLYADERDRLARIAKACLDSGMGRAEVEMAEAEANALAKATNAAFSHVRGLTNDQKREFGLALRSQLAELARTPEEREKILAGGSATQEERARFGLLDPPQAGSAEQPVAD
jgi:hypothetical protein